MKGLVNSAPASFEMAANAMQNTQQAAMNAKNMNAEQAREAAKEFEAVFISQMLGMMFEGASAADSVFGGGKAEEIYQSLMVNEYGKQMAQNGGIGISDAVLSTILQMQENQNGG